MSKYTLWKNFSRNFSKDKASSALYLLLLFLENKWKGVNA